MRRASEVQDLQPTLVRADPCLAPTLCVGLLSALSARGLSKNTTAITATNKTLSDPLTWKELLRFMGILYLLATTQGVPRQLFWENDHTPTFSLLVHRFGS